MYSGHLGDHLLLSIFQINIAAFVADPAKTLPEQYVPPPAVSGEDVPKETIQETYADWGPEMTKLFSCIETAKKWDINVVYPPIEPENWTRGTVAILGDAVSHIATSRMLACSYSAGAWDAAVPRIRCRTRARGRLSSESATGSSADKFCQRCGECMLSIDLSLF